MLLGCIGDDFTGSSDLANTLAKGGMRTVQYCGVPIGPAAPEVEAGVVALKSRSIPVADAIAQSLAALEWLRSQGCTQFFFKYCSTFDSTQDGNIGPVAEALADALDATQVIVCPAFPGAGRSIYQGHLFVNDTLLNESGMQDHPLTPMIDADIRRWLSAQCQGSVGHVTAVDVLQGAGTIRAALSREAASGHQLIVVDALQDVDLVEIGKAAKDLTLVTGGSGVALGLPGNFELFGNEQHWTRQAGRCVALSGSCSVATRAQVKLHAQTNPSFQLDVDQIMSGAQNAEDVAVWAVAQKGVPLVYSSSDPDNVTASQDLHGREAASQAIEGFFAELAKELVAVGIECLLPAGGETSGAVVEGLGLESFEIGPEIDPGVPALRAGPNLVLALKSGNFGAPDYFAKAAKVLAG